jgi:hypothetical protein
MSGAFKNEWSLDGAARCPVCHLAPAFHEEPSVNPYRPDAMSVVIRCPIGHPYVAMGDDLPMAIKHWNIYIEFRENEAAGYRAAAQGKTTMMSFCKNENKYTQSRVQVDRDQVTEFCTECHLVKNVKDAF